MKNVFVILLVFSVFIVSCSSNDTVTSSQNNGTININLNKANAPENVVEVVATFSRENYSDIIEILNFLDNNSAETIIENLSVGSWHILIEAKNLDGIVIYKGETDVMVEAGITTPVFLQLNPLNGNIIISVSWGNNEDYALNFDGIDDVAINEYPKEKLDSISNEITIEGWIKVNSFNNEFPRILERSDNTIDDRYLIGLSQSNKSVHFNINGYSLNSNSILTNEWIHIAGVYNGQYMLIYVNGSLENEMNVVTNINVNESALYVGNNELNNRQFDGSISDLRIWNKALSSQEINSAMNNDINITDKNLICNWSFNEGAGQIAVDQINDNYLKLGTTWSKDSNDPNWELVSN